MLPLGIFPKLEADLTITGNTPAKDVIGWINISVMGTPASWEDLPAPPGPTVIGPSRGDLQKDSHVVFSAPYQLNPQEFDDIKNKKRFLVMYGSVSYKDIFGDQAETKYCWFLDTVTNDASECPGHNHIR